MNGCQSSVNSNSPEVELREGSIVATAKFNFNGTKLCSSDEDSLLIVWYFDCDLENKKLILANRQTFKSQKGVFTTITFRPKHKNHLCVATIDLKIFILSIEKSNMRNEIIEFHGTSLGKITSLSFSSDGMKLCSSDEAKIRVYRFLGIHLNLGNHIY